MEAYSRVHRNRTNLMIHLFMVPFFIGSVLAIGWSLLQGHWLWSAALVAGPVVSLVFQGYGHKLEAIAPEPFTGPGNFVKRIFVEQFYTFPRFVLSGGWLSSWRSGTQ